MAACFITDLGTVLALGVVFAHSDAWLALFGAATAAVLWLLPKFAPWFFDKVGHRVSEPEKVRIADFAVAGRIVPQAAVIEDVDMRVSRGGWQE